MNCKEFSIFDIKSGEPQKNLNTSPITNGAKSYSSNQQEPDPSRETVLLNVVIFHLSVELMEQNAFWYTCSTL